MSHKELVKNKVRELQKSLGVEPDGYWGGISQETLEKGINDKQVRLYFDFNKFKDLFKTNRLNQGFVDGVNGLFEAFNKFELLDSSNPLYVAYMLGTSYHETAYTMQAITEYGDIRYFDKYDTGTLAARLGNTPEKDGDGYKYRGRGHVMITGLGNYKKFTKILGIDLVNVPDLALDPVVSASILVIGSLEGTFTTRKLSQYIKYGLYIEEFYNARRVINGTDDAREIANHAVKFLQCIIIEKVESKPAEYEVCACCGSTIKTN